MIHKSFIIICEYKKMCSSNIPVYMCIQLFTYMYLCLYAFGFKSAYWQ